jgi:hypothetical protein
MFNKDKFLTTEFEQNIAKVPVPQLKEFFDDEDNPVWIVRGLTGHELGKVNEAAQRNRTIGAILDGIISPEIKEKVDALKAIIGLTDDTPDDIARRIEMLVIGSVDPKIDHETAVRISEYHPTRLYELTNTIILLGGQGALIKKK